MQEEPLPLEDERDDPIRRRRRQLRYRFLVKLFLTCSVLAVLVTASVALAMNVAARKKQEASALVQADPPRAPANSSSPDKNTPARPKSGVASRPEKESGPSVLPGETKIPLPQRDPSEVEEPKIVGPGKPLKKIDPDQVEPIGVEAPIDPVPKTNPTAEKKQPAKAPSPAAKPAGNGAFQTVVAEGVGKDEKEAKKAAFRDAVSRVVGTLVDAETLVKNDEIISERIIEFSGGFIKTHEVLKTETTPEGLVRVRIKATVERLMIASKLADAKVATKEVRGEDLLGEKMTKEEAKKNATELLAKLYSDLPKLMKADVKGQPQLTDTRDGVYIDIVLSVDTKGYETFAKRAAALLDKMAIAKDSILVAGELRQGGGGEVAYSQKVQFAGLPKLGQNTPKGYAVWLLTQLDKTGAQMRWNLYWVDADIAKTLEPIAGEVQLHTELLDGDGKLLTEEELPLFLTDSHSRRQFWLRGGMKEWGLKEGYWMLWSHSPREYFVDGEKRQTISLFIAPFVTELDAGTGFGPTQGEYMTSKPLRRKIKLIDDDLGQLKQVKASIEFKAGELGNKKR